MDLIPVIARIALRYLSGALVAYGVIPHEAGAELAMDPDLALVVGAALGAVVEAFYAAVKARGGKT
jgi:preprotein translocase subunit Sec61beta